MNDEVTVGDKGLSERVRVVLAKVELKLKLIAVEPDESFGKPLGGGIIHRPVQYGTGLEGAL